MKPSAQNEDEDLFNFPFIEMTLEGIREVGTSVEASAEHLVQNLVSADAHASKPSPAAIKSPAQPVAAEGPTTGHVTPATNAGATTQAPAPKVAPPAKTSTPAAAPKALTPTTAQTSAATTLPKPMNSATQGASQPSDVVVPFSGKPGRLQGLARSTPVWIALGATLVLNVAMLAWLLSSSSAFQAGLEGLRNDLAVNARELKLEASRVGGPTHAAEPKLQVPNPVPAPRSEPTELADSYERTTLALAQREIDNGAFPAARKRLYRLLALADRIEPGLRAETEAGAHFLVADSYRLQGVVREQRP